LHQTGLNHCGNHSFVVSYFDLFGDVVRSDSFAPSVEPKNQPISRFFGSFQIVHRGNPDLFLQFNGPRTEGKQLRQLIFGPQQSAVVFSVEISRRPQDGWTRVRAEGGGFWIVAVDEKKGPQELCVQTGDPTGDRTLFRFAHGNIFPKCGGECLCLTVTRESKPQFQKVRGPSPRQFFEVLSCRPVRALPVCSGKELVGEFRVRHVATGKFLAAGSTSWGTLTLGFEFADNGDFFKAESSGVEWTRVIGKDDLVWFALKAGIPSEFGLDRWSDRTSVFCLFKYRNGYIMDRQRERVLTFGNDGRPWLDEQKPGDDPSQKFEIILNENESFRDLNLEIDKPIPIEVIVDGFQLDSFA
jgi:hypothetical protein